MADRLWRGRLRARLALLGLVSLAAGCAGSEPGLPGGGSAAELARPRGIVVVTLDQWWAPGRGEDPFAGFDLEGVIHPGDSLTVSPQLRPAVAAALTGKLPLEVGVTSDSSTALPADAPYLPARLKESGYATAGFVNDPVLGWGSGFERGFELFDGPEGHVLVPIRYFPTLADPEERVANFLQWVESLPAGKPFFAWIHLTGTNWQDPASREQEAAPGGARGTAESEEEKQGESEEGKKEAPPETQEEGRRPRGETVQEQLARLDEALAALHEAARRKDRLKEAAWVLAAVQGRSSLEEPERSGYFLRPEVIEVPARARLPRAASGALPDRAAWWTPDIAAFVAEQVGLEPAGEAAAKRPRTRSVWNWKAAEEFGWPPSVAVEREGVLLVRGAEGRRAYRRGDQGWTVSNHEAAAGELAAALEGAWEAARAPRGPRPPIPEELERLVAEAYDIHLPDEPQRAEPPGADAQLEVVRQIVRARRFAVRAMTRSAGAAYRKAGELDPANRAAYVERGQILSLRGSQRAKPVLKQALERDPWDAQAWHWLGHIGFLEQQVPTAEKILQFANLLQPGDPDILYDLACARSLGQDIEGAERYLRQAWDAGYRNLAHIQTDPDLRFYRESGSFQRFMQERVQ